MKSINNFKPKTKEIFAFNYVCWECGRNRIDDAHHILGRGTKHSKIESSAFNLAPLCRKCHEAGDINSPEKRKKYLNKTIDYLILENYKPTNKDFQFLETYKYNY